MTEAGGWSEQVAFSILAMLENILKAGSPLGQAMREAYDKACEAAKSLGEFIHDHPIWFTIIALGVSLGTAAFMAVGAFGAYNFMLRIDGMPILAAFALAGLCAAAVGIVFGLPSLRIRGFYLAASTLATQFFIVWCVTKIPWLTNYSASGIITAQKIEILGYAFDTPPRKYLFVLAMVVG